MQHLEGQFIILCFIDTFNIQQKYMFVFQYEFHSKYPLHTVVIIAIIYGFW